jgi:hypothetical protein
MNNPQAFPISGSQYKHTEGMTLRDYFAAKAMQGAISTNGFYDDELQFAKWCYETADAMLEARKN